jgi:hypothetical protein
MTGKTDPAGTVEAFRAIAAELADAYWEQSAVVCSLVTAVLAGQHGFCHVLVFQGGKPCP